MGQRRAVAAGGSQSLGFQGTYSGTHAEAAPFTLDLPAR
ncbi:cellulose-binding domain-containing protein [Streptomyces atroolivaceus]|uniref:Cellulose-binding domain-containing protein n=1 Tax=Streptomyces atroolivaceus TaxID=66869 RepID=A0ABV9VFZ9_STRAZ|nr:cellulose-binding domain-containing protein [Streptomyces atroolivaceus]